MFPCTECGDQHSSPLAAAECGDQDRAEELRLQRLRKRQR